MYPYPEKCPMNINQSAEAVEIGPAINECELQGGVGVGKSNVEGKPGDY